MTNCAVPGCKENGYHLFPKNKDRKKLWAKAIKRPELAKSQCTYLRLCRHHFTENDFRAVKSSTGKYLQPTIFNTLYDLNLSNLSYVHDCPICRF